MVQYTVVLITIASLAVGCGSGAEKGANKDLDRPKAVPNAPKADTKSEK